MSSNVQSIICCLGDPVAGNPTQFLMQRAAASLSIDWMFVTAEVPEGKINEAFQGIRALRFSGVAFLPPHRSVGCNLVDSMTEAALRTGHVRVARRDGDLWLGDDTLGAGVVELLRSISSDSIVTSESSHCGLILIAGRPSLSHLVRLAAPVDWLGRLREVVELQRQQVVGMIDPSMLQRDGARATEVTRPPEVSASIAVLSLDDATTGDLFIDSLVIDATAACMSTRQLAKLRWTDNPSVIFVEPNSSWEAALKGADIPNLRVLRALDIAAAKAVVNFHFWTGHHIDLSVVRESLDEYCQW